MKSSAIPTIRAPSAGTREVPLAASAQQPNLAKSSWNGTSRREFVRKGRDALVVGFSLYRGIPPAIAWGQTAAPTTPTAKPVIPEELDSWLSIGRDGKVTVYTGRIDMGTGVETAFGQLIADELDVPFESVKIVMGDTEFTPDQGKSTASSNAAVGAQPLRIAAAEARRTLLKMAADRFGVSVDELDVEDGIVRVRSVSSKRISYAELIGGGRFMTRLDQKAESGEEAARTGITGLPQPIASRG